VTPEELAGYEFAAGSMGPKVEAASRFVAKTGGRAAIGSLADITGIVAGQAGTSVVADLTARTGGRGGKRNSDKHQNEARYRTKPNEDPIDDMREDSLTDARVSGSHRRSVAGRRRSVTWRRWLRLIPFV
jgi:hypothetical protein